MNALCNDAVPHECHSGHSSRVPGGTWIFEVVDEVVSHFESSDRALPMPRARPMQEVA